MPIGALLFAVASQVLSAPPPNDQAAVFTAAGFVRRGAEWRTRDCEGMEGASYTPGSIDEYRDINDDGRPDAVISEGSAICYGMAGTRFWLVSKNPDGRWTVVTSEIGMPIFLATKGANGWPDLQIGGPGFCFPVNRWNGRAYAHQRFEYDGKRCAGR